MPRRRSTQLMMMALTASLAVHGCILAVADVVIARKHRDAMLARASAEPPMIPVELVLGVDEPMPPSPTWLGYVEPQAHAAPPSPIDQAAFTDQPSAPPMTPRQALQRAAQVRREISQALQQLLASLAPRASNGTSEPADAMVENASVEQSATEGPIASELEPGPQMVVEVAVAGALGEPGDASDKQSPPASIIDVPPDQWKLGKPLVGEGLEIKPHRPTFTLLTLMTAAPGNPLCEINFDSHGVPQSAKIVETSGDPRVDHAILASLYRWRAAGTDLAQLSESETLPVQMRILLTRRRTA